MPDPISARRAKKALNDKGFAIDERDHKYFVHRDAQGRRTGPYVYFSEGGNKADTIGPSLMKLMKNELWLDRIQDVADLLECPMTEERFLQIVEQRRQENRERNRQQ